MRGTPKINEEAFVPQGGEAQFIAALLGDGNCEFDPKLGKENRTLRGSLLSEILQKGEITELKRVKLPLRVGITNAFIDGEFNLMDCDCRFGLIIINSELSNAPVFVRTKLKFLHFYGSKLPGANLSGLISEGEVTFDKTEVFGLLDLAEAKISGQLSFFQSSLISLNGRCLMLQDAKIQNGIFLDNMRHNPIGSMFLHSARIHFIQVDDKTWPVGGLVSSELIYTNISHYDGFKRKAVWKGWLCEASKKDRRDSRVLWEKVKQSLEVYLAEHDSLNLRFRKIDRDNYFYGSVYNRIEIINEILWAQSTEAKFSPQPWRQYAKVLDAEGHEIEARRVRTELARRMTNLNVERMKVQNESYQKIWIYRAWRCVFGAVSDYGLMPVKSLVWSFGLLAFGTIFFFGFSENMALAREKVYMDAAYLNWERGDALPDGYPRFHALIYALDVMLPIVDFAQESHWRPKNVESGINWLRWYNRFHLAFGWFLSTIFVLGFTGLIRDKKEP